MIVNSWTDLISVDFFLIETRANLPKAKGALSSKNVIWLLPSVDYDKMRIYSGLPIRLINLTDKLFVKYKVNATLLAFTLRLMTKTLVLPRIKRFSKPHQLRMMVRLMSVRRPIRFVFRERLRLKDLSKSLFLLFEH